MIRCIAIDDEPIALSIIERFCLRRGNIELKTYTNPQIGIQQVLKEKPHLVLLDIEMNDISGIALARSLPPESLLVFTTAYANYALEGFELNAIDFLHKPFSFGRFERTIDKAQRIVEARNIKNEATNNRKIILKVEYKNVTVSLSDILYIEAMDNYLKVHKTTGRSIVTQMSMKNILLLLCEEEFIRVHKSYIVPIDKISSFTKRLIQLQNTTTIPVGRIYADNLCGRLLGNPSEE